MKVLFVTFQHPWPPDVGGRQRLFYLARELAKRHEVTLVSLLPTESPDRAEWDKVAAETFTRVIETDCRAWSRPEPVGRSRWASRAFNLKRLFLNRMPRQVQNWTTPEAQDYFAWLASEVPHDVAWIDKAYIACQAKIAGLPRIVVDLMELETIKMERDRECERGRRRVFNWLEWRKLRMFERRLPGEFWRVAVCSPNDKDFFGADARNVFVVPNGINELPPIKSPVEENGNLLFVGAMDYRPNHDAVSWFARTVLPGIVKRNSRAVFHVVGQAPESDIAALHDGSGVHVHGRVPRVAEYYQQASVVVAPIRLGSGTRLKVLEALNWGKALVATGTAVEGLDLRPGVDFAQADTEADMISACCRLLEDGDERRRLGSNGREHVRKRFSWNSIGEALDAAVTP